MLLEIDQDKLFQKLDILVERKNLRRDTADFIQKKYANYFNKKFPKPYLLLLLSRNIGIYKPIKVSGLHPSALDAFQEFEHSLIQGDEDNLVVIWEHGDLQVFFIIKLNNTMVTIYVKDLAYTYIPDNDEEDEFDLFYDEDEEKDHEGEEFIDIIESVDLASEKGWQTLIKILQQYIL